MSPTTGGSGTSGSSPPTTAVSSASCRRTPCAGGEEARGQPGEGVTSLLGPELTGVGQRLTRLELLQSIVDPESYERAVDRFRDSKILLPTLAAVFVGGTSVFGGRGSIYGTFIGAFMIGGIGAGIVAVGLTDFYTNLIYGAIILISISVHAILQRRFQRLRQEEACMPDLLIIDDLGLHPLRPEEPEDLYEIIRQRYERGSLIVTSNRDVEEWYPLFGDALLASAASMAHDGHEEKPAAEGSRIISDRYAIQLALTSSKLTTDVAAAQLDRGRGVEPQSLHARYLRRAEAEAKRLGGPVEQGELARTESSGS